MQKSEIQVGQEYALREERNPQAPLQRVKIIQHMRGKKWKVEWIDPNPGLVDYIESKNLIVRWKDRKAFLQDEDKSRQLREDNERHSFDNDSPLDCAVTQVFESIGEKDLSYYRGVFSGRPDALERVKDRAGLDRNKDSVYTYIDRFGSVHISYAQALEIAKAFCSREPSPVLMKIESTEREWVQEGSYPGNEYIIPLLNEYRASWAILRQWTGYDAAIAQKEDQIQRLERLVFDAIYALQKAGLDNEANRLRRAMQKR
jgi:hypothetical protein